MGKTVTKPLLQDHDNDEKLSCLAGFWRLCKTIIKSLQGGGGGEGGGGRRRERLSDPISTYHLINHKDYNELPSYSNQYRVVDVIKIEEPIWRNWMREDEDEIEKAVVVEEEDPHPPQPLKSTLFLGLYNSKQRILLVGDGDFSFSTSLATAFGDASYIIATSLDSYEFLTQNYAKARNNIKELTSRSCKVIHGVDATMMSHHPELKSVNFDRIVYNFPHAGFANRNDTREAQIKTHRKLVMKFLKNAKRMINKEDGQIHVTHKCAGFFLEWNITKIGMMIGLQFVEEAPFYLGLYPGYATKFGYGGDANFNCFPAKTYKFKLLNPKPKK